MDAADEYEFDYEAESPPRASQQTAPAESPTVRGNDQEESQSDTEQPQPEQQDVQAEGARHGEEEVADSPVGSADESSPASSPRLRLRCKRPRRTDKLSATSLVASLTRKLTQAKKHNAKIYQQLQKFYQNDAIAFLENKAQERQRQIDALQMENRTLLHQQRVLNKQIVELQDTVENMPAKRITQREELRICREQLSHYKENQKVADNKAARVHQHVVDLTAANKILVDKVKRLEGELASMLSSSSPLFASNRSAASLTQEQTETVIASQENEITRLLHRVDVMKKAIKLDQSKHDKQTLAAQEELEKTRSDLEAFHHHAFEQEKRMRSQFLEIKQLKRSLKDATTRLHGNQQLHQAVGGGAMRFANHTHTLSTTTLGANAMTAQDLLGRLGLLPLASSPSKTFSVRLVGGVSAVNLPQRQDGKLHQQQRQRHTPCPPPPVLISEKKTPRSARSHAQTTVVATTPTPTRSKAHARHHGGADTAFPTEPFYEDVDRETFASLPSGMTTANGSGASANRDD